MAWSKNIVTFRDAKTLNVSVVFSWHLSIAIAYVNAMRSSGHIVRLGGPAAKLAGIQDGEQPALKYHNPEATFTSRGCIRRCEFCAVPKIEGALRELQDWDPQPIVCDNNLLACSQRHFDMVIDRLKPIKGVDFNQGLDCRLLTAHHIDRLKELSLPMIRFAWDYTPLENSVLSAIDRMVKAGFPKSRIRCLVLFGYHDTPEDALYRFETLKARGIKALPMRYQPLNATRFDSYVEQSWTEHELHKMRRYWFRQNWLSKVPYAEFTG